MKNLIAITTLTIAMLCTVVVSGCMIAAASEHTVDKDAAIFTAVADKASHELMLQRETAKRTHAMEAFNLRQAAQEALQGSIEDDVEVFTDYEYIEPYVASQSVVRGNPDGLNSFDGVNEYNGKTETFYSTSAVYDADCHVDEDGFWRTDDGHYVVASSDYEPGTEIDISQGKAIVMDDGCESGTVDVHTNW